MTSHRIAIKFMDRSFTRYDKVDSGSWLIGANCFSIWNTTEKWDVYFPLVNIKSIAIENYPEKEVESK